MWRRLRASFFAGLAMLVSIALGHAQGSNPRLAFVVGNAGYAAGPLATAANDAGLVAEGLALSGFDVMAIADGDSDTLAKAADAFVAKARTAGGPNTEIVVYLSGYGLQSGGENVLVPVDAPKMRDVEVAPHAFQLSGFMGSLQAVPAKARLFIYDLARPSPFPPAGDSLASGLATVEAQAGSLVAINTAPGTIAPTNIGIYGTYARNLVDVLRTPNLPINEAFEKLRLRIVQITNGAEVPWNDSKLPPNMSLASRNSQFETSSTVDRPMAALSPDVAFYIAIARDTLASYDAFLAAFPDDPLSTRIRTIAAARREDSIWIACTKADQPPCYWTYLRRYPHGPHMYDAKRKLAALHTTLEPPPRFDVWDFGNLGLPSSDELTILARRPLATARAERLPLPMAPEGFTSLAQATRTETPFPPLAVAGALPIAMPTAVASGIPSGAIAQPFAPGFDDLVTTFRGGRVTMTTTNRTALVAHTEISDEQGNRVVTQRDAYGAIVSRSATSQTHDAITTVLTGPGGGVLAKSVTTLGPSGDRATTILNGKNQLLAAIDVNKNGVQTDVKGGTLPVGDQRMVFKPAQGAKGAPSIEAAPIATPKDFPPPPPPAPSPEQSPPLPKVETPAETVPATPDATPAKEPMPPTSDAGSTPKTDSDRALPPATEPPATTALPAAGPSPPRRPRNLRPAAHAFQHKAATPRRGPLKPAFRPARGRRR